MSPGRGRFRGVSALGVRLFAALAWVLLPVAASAQAEPSPQQARWIRDFAGIAGAWWVNQECHHLSTAERKEFQFHVGEITEALAAKEGMRSHVLRTVKVAQDYARQQDCGRTKQLVYEALDAARRLSAEVSGRVYTPGESDTVNQILGLQKIAGAVGVAERCHFGGEEGLGRFVALYEANLRHMRANQISPDFADRIAAMRSLARQSAQPACTAATEQAVLQFVLLNRSIGFDLGLYDPDSGQITE